MTETKYKILTKDQVSPYQDTKYKRRKWYHEPEIGKPGNGGCVKGLYATDIEGLLYRGLWRKNEQVYECRVKCQEAGTAPLKTCYEYLQIVKPISESEVRELARKEHERLGYLLEDALYPINPLQIQRKHEAPTESELELLRQWVKVWDSVWNSVWNSVRNSVRYSVENSVENSVWDSVWNSVVNSVWYLVVNSVWYLVVNSVWDSVYAYIGSLFPAITDWRGVDYEPGKYPFESGNQLWRAGLVSSYDGSVWRLHSGPAAKVVWEGTEEEL